MKNLKLETRNLKLAALTLLTALTLSTCAFGATNVYLALPMSTVNAYLATIPGTTTTVATLTANLESVSNDLDIAEAALASTTGNVAQVTSDLSDLSGIVTTATGNVAQVTSDLSDLSGIVTTATGNVAQVTSDLSDLSGIVTTATGNVATVTATLAAGISTNFTFLSATDVTGQVWFASGILTNFDLNIGD